MFSALLSYFQSSNYKHLHMHTRMYADTPHYHIDSRRKIWQKNKSMSGFRVDNNVSWPVMSECGW